VAPVRPLSPRASPVSPSRPVKSVLFVSKPVAPPWNDSSKNLVRDIACNLSRHSAAVMTRRGQSSALRGVEAEAVYGASGGGFAPALVDNARVLGRLLLGSSRHALWHFFFAPNPRSSAAGRMAARVRRVPTVQTVCSAPAAGADLHAVLFADRVVVLSRHTETRLLDAGIARERVLRIAPAVAPLAVPDEAARREARTQLGLPLDRPLIVYPGDLEFSGAAERMLRAHARLPAGHAAFMVLACRAKTAQAEHEAARLRALADTLGIAADVAHLAETRAIHALLGAADIVALPAENLYAKMDLPLVLIEAMYLGRATIVCARTAAAELAEGEAAVVVEPDVDATVAALCALLDDPGRRATLGVAARARALAQHDPCVVADQHDALYDGLLQ